jgi:hypothetical protein
VLFLFIRPLFVIVFSICMLLTSPAYDVVCLCVDVLDEWTRSPIEMQELIYEILKTALTRWSL